jgi:hypothetical protein
MAGAFDKVRGCRLALAVDRKIHGDDPRQLLSPDFRGVFFVLVQFSLNLSSVSPQKILAAKSPAAAGSATPLPLEAAGRDGLPGGVAGQIMNYLGVKYS